MGFPTILVNSTGGSDTAASGAGPATALTGSAGVSAADGLSVVLDGSPDLSGVATDGTHVLFYNDSNAGSRNFAKITGTSNSGTPTATVTIANAVRTLQTKAWAIGGKRSAIGTTLSRKLFDNNSAAGDALVGWIVEMQSGHTETLSSIIFRGSPSTSGSITLRGTSGAATLPILKFNDGNNGLRPFGGSNVAPFVFKDFELQASVSDSSYAIDGSAAFVASGIKVSNAGGKKFNTGIYLTGTSNVLGCDVSGCSSGGAIQMDGAYNTVAYNYIHDNTIHGIYINAVNPAVIINNIIETNTGASTDGINIGSTGSTNLRPIIILGNTIYANGRDGVRNNTSSGFGEICGALITNNIFDSNGGYGINFTATDAQISAMNPLIYNNDFNNNTSGASNPSTITVETGRQTLSPQFTNTGGKDFSIGANLKALGYPTGGTIPVGGKSGSTYSYVDIGAAQRQEPAASSGGSAVAIFGSN